MRFINKNTPFILVALLILAGIFVGVTLHGAKKSPSAKSPASVSSYKECVAAGNPVQESYPTVCRTSDGQSFVNPDEHVTPPTE